MKYLFYLLLIGNVVFYLWETGVGGERTKVERRELALPDETERLVLLRELPDAPKKARGSEPSAQIDRQQMKEESAVNAIIEESQLEAKKATPQPSPVPTIKPDPSCHLFGPIDGEAQANKAMGELKPQLTGEVDVVRRPAETIGGYWVLYPKAENLDAAKINRRMLMDKGIRDIWLFDKGELAGAISLGLYHSQQRAEAAQKKFFEQNLKTEVVPRLVREEAYWLKVHWEASRDELDQLIGKTSIQRRDARLQGCD